MLYKILILLFISTVAFGQFTSDHTGDHIDSVITKVESFINPTLSPSFWIGQGADSTVDVVGTEAFADTIIPYLAIKRTYIIAATNSSDNDKGIADVICDGINDAQLIQNVLDVLSTHSTIKLLDGTYTVSNLSTNANFEYALIDTVDNTTIEGSGYNTIIKLADSQPANTGVISLGDGTGNSNITLRNLTIDWNVDNNPACDDTWFGGVLIQKVDNARVENVRFINNNGLSTGGGGVIRTYNNCTRTKILNNEIIQYIGNGITSDGDKYSTFAGNYLSSVGDVSRISAGGISLVANDDVGENYSEYMVIENNTIITDGQYALYMRGGRFNRFLFNRFFVSETSNDACIYVYARIATRDYYNNGNLYLGNTFKGEDNSMTGSYGIYYQDNGVIYNFNENIMSNNFDSLRTAIRGSTYDKHFNISYNYFGALNSTVFTSITAGYHQVLYNKGKATSISTLSHFDLFADSGGIYTPYVYTITQDSNYSAGVNVINSSTGTAAISKLLLGESATSGEYGYYGHFSSGYTGNQIFQPNLSLLYGGLSGDLGVYSAGDGSNQRCINFYTGSNASANLRMKMRYDGYIESNAINFYVDTSTVADTWGVGSTNIPALMDGLAIRVKVAVANTDGATFGLSTLGTYEILKKHDQSLATGDVEVGQIIEIIWSTDQSKWQMLSQLAQ